MTMNNGISILQECKSPTITLVGNSSKQQIPEKNSSGCSKLADPVISSATKKPFFFVNLSELSSNPIISDDFITTHLKGKIQCSKLKLTSDASDKTWEVELDGWRFAGGWKDFSVSHRVRDDDVLGFRHDGDMIFHVTPFGRSFSQRQFIASTYDDNEDEEDDDNDDDDEDEDDDDDDSENADGYENSTSEEDLHPKKISSKKRVRTEAEPSSGKSYLIAHVTASSISRNHLSIPYKFARSNGLSERQCEIDLMNEDGESWTLGLNNNKSTGQVYINGGWRNFCKANGLKAGSFCRFKVIQSRTKPVLQLCANSSSIPERNSSKGKEKRIASESDEDDESETEDCPETASMNQNKIVTLELKHYMLKSAQLRLPASFTRDNKIEKPGEVTMVDNDGGEWKLQLISVKGRSECYIRGCRPMCQANGVKKIGDPFTLEVIRGGPNPILKFCPKVKQTSVVDGYETPERTAGRKVRASQDEEETETRAEKRARVEGGTSRCTRASNKSSVEPENLQSKQPVQPCSIFDIVEKVKQSTVDMLTFTRQFRSELEIKEQNLENLRLDLDALGEKIMDFSQIFNINQV